MTRCSKKWVLVLCVMLVCYVGSHFVLSRLSIAKLQGTSSIGFYYVPCSMEALFRSDSLRILHGVLYFFYYPVWYIESDVFGGPYPYMMPPRYPDLE